MHRTWMIPFVLFTAAFFGCQGTLTQLDDDDDAGDDDAGDDDAGDDDAGDDDAGDDDAGDDDAGDDDSGPECPMLCDFYEGWTGITIHMPDGQAMETECPAWAEVTDCFIEGMLECQSPNGEMGWELLGEGYPDGDLDGEILASGPQGPVSWPWAGSTTGKDLHGTFSNTNPQGGLIEGQFNLVCEGWDSGDEPSGP